MDIMFWVWLSVLIVTAIIEFATMEIVSIWFTFGAVIPLILAATKAVSWEIQVVIFVVLSAVLIVSLRQITKKFLLRNTEGKTNLDAIIGQKYRMISRTDFETVGSLKVNDVVWSAVGENQETIEKDEIVEIVKIKGNKLIVKKASKEKTETKEETKLKKNDKKLLVNKEKEIENFEIPDEKISKSNVEKVSAKKQTNPSKNAKNLTEKSEKININKKAVNSGKTTKNTSAKSTKITQKSKNLSEKSNNSSKNVKNSSKNTKKSTKKGDN